MAATLKLALFGHPVAHSRSPAIHAAFGDAAGIAVDYRLIDVPSAADGARALNRALTAFVGAGGQGANVTSPFKRDALKLCAEVGAEARAAGAVNTLIVGPDRRLRGDDTDGEGLVRDLVGHHRIDLAGQRVALLGSGGAARGAARALLAAGVAELALAYRDAAGATNLVRDLAAPRFRAGSYAELEGGAFDLVVNATSASLRGELPPLPGGVLARDAVAYDLVYADAPTPFQRWAEAGGARLAADGWGMLLEQAAASFALWTGRRPDTAELRRR